MSLFGACNVHENKSYPQDLCVKFYSGPNDKSEKQEQNKNKTKQN